MKALLKHLLTTKTQSTYLQFFRYGFVSSGSLIVDFGLLVFLKEYVHLNYLVAASISFTAGLLLNFFLSMCWVFHSPKLLNKSHQFLLFSAIGLVGLGFTDSIMWVLTSYLGLFYIVSKIIATVVVYFWNFGARKKYLFY